MLFLLLLFWRIIGYLVAIENFYAKCQENFIIQLFMLELQKVTYLTKYLMIIIIEIILL